MLAIQPISVKPYSRPSFGQKYEGDESLEDNRAFFEDQKAQISELMDDDKLPGGMKKGLKVVSVLTDGIIAGISVACATIAGAKWGKGAYSKISKSNFAKDAAADMKPVKEFLGKKADAFKDFVSKKSEAFLETNFGKKVLDLYNSFKETKFGEIVVDFAKKAADKTKKFFKSLNIFQSEEKYDKAAKKTATVLGTGSGVASAYATSVKESEMSEAQE